MIFISRDVKIEELGSWKLQNPNSQQEKKKLFDFDDEKTTKHVETMKVRKLQRDRNVPLRLNDYDMLSNANVSSEGDIVHFALFVEEDPIRFKEAIVDPIWVNTMKE